jgi:hypothetical protein
MSVAVRRPFEHATDRKNLLQRSPRDLASIGLVAQLRLSEQRGHQVVEKEQHLRAESRPGSSRMIERNDGFRRDLPRHGHIGEGGCPVQLEIDASHGCILGISVQNVPAMTALGGYLNSEHLPLPPTQRAIARHRADYDPSHPPSALPKSP